MEDKETKKRSGGVPIGMPIAAVVLLVLGLIANPLIQNSASEEQMASNVILSALPFILIFAAIVVAFMSLIWFASSRLSNNISAKTYRPIELALIAGILLGVFFMFQPWVFALFRVGFFVLLFSTLGYILWSHVRPKAEEDELAVPATGEVEKG